MRWHPDEPHAGFTTGEPWLPIGPDAETLNLSTQRANSCSIPTFFRALLALRHRDPALRSVAPAPLRNTAQVVALRGGAPPHRPLLVALDLSDAPQVLEGIGAGKVLLSPHLDRHGAHIAGDPHLRPDEGLVLVEKSGQEMNFPAPIFILYPSEAALSACRAIRRREMGAWENSFSQPCSLACLPLPPAASLSLEYLFPFAEPSVTSFRFLHAADLHLDSPLRGLDVDLDAPAQRIRQASRQALANLVELAIAEAVDFVVIAGDLYDGDWQDFRTGQVLIAALGRLTRAGIRVIAIRGNHDAESVLTRNLRLPDGATLLSARTPETARLPEIGVAVHGQSFATRDVQDNLARGYPAPLPGFFNLGLLHTAATGRPGHASYAPCTVEQLAGHGYDYWALGHIHTREEVLRNPWIVFPGNIQGRHVNEPGAKGATLVTVRDGRVAEVAHRVLDTVRWQRLAVDCRGAADLEQALERVRNALGAALDDTSGRLLALRLTLEGDCAAHAALARDPLGTRERVRAAGLEVAEEGAFWIEAVRVGTRPLAGPTVRGLADDAAGRLLGAIEAMSDGTDHAALAEAVQAYAATLLDRAGGLREALGAEHPAVLAAEGRLSPKLLRRARQLLLSRLNPD
ncbi:DUF3459 domain-containing protein [Roseomonas sp. M0104]|uniref:DUF3459 domain-containing protein n=1 Tax=Teichococcus coralli TaxID=2545983 RepID=A0A845BGF7_9PROT|nr:metallophosphoesterase [Pseudoroseomonas coralli]MXP64302.1 DUF3459 domain-containing protein [Pseudoroseomonas coralli]